MYGRRGAAWALALSWSLTGCMLANMTPRERFSDCSHELNHASRWGRVDLAVSHVSPDYRARFLASHREWGQLLKIADHDVVELQLAEDGRTATSRVRVSWYRLDSLQLHESTLEQRWERRRGQFYLVREAVGSGDQGLLSDES